MNLMLHYGFSALVAQRIEQLPSKQWVVGSIPARGTIFFALIPRQKMKSVKALLHNQRIASHIRLKK